MDQIITVLHRPRDVRNIGAAVRALKNMGFRRLRLVDPAPFDPADLTGIAHRSEDLVAAIELYADLDAALADARYVVGTSERAHPERPMRADLRPFAAELVTRATSAGPVALLFGPEDHGLDNAALDRCHALLTLPADPAYPSLNLAQAVLLTLYELRMAVAGPLPAAPPRRPATAAELAATVEALSAAIEAVGFVKSGDGAAVVRRLRALITRAEPDSREAALLTAFAREIVYALHRRV
ncbi:MAG: TrmH family RNA methyltransferase [Chloroflexaceae bacterium]